VLESRTTDNRSTRLGGAGTARQPFVGLTMMAMLAIIVADSFPLPPVVWLPVGLISFAAALAVLRWPTVTLAYALVGVGFFLLHSFRIEDTPGLRLAAQLGEGPRAISATGFVMDEPKIAPNGFATFLFNLQSIELEGRTLPTEATLLVRWRGEPHFGDEFKLFGIAEPVAPPRNPGEFDMCSYLARRDVRRNLFVRYAEDGVLLRHGGGNPILRAAQASRVWMQGVLCRSLESSPEVQNFLSGIVLGLRHQTPEDIEEPFQQTGTLHLFAVAGLHVGIVAQLLWILATVGRVSRKWATRLIIPLLLFYAAVTGLHVSSIRAAVMSSVFLGGFFAERRVFRLNSLAAAAFFLLSWNTNELFSTGFQLSFAVVGAIILLADPFFLFLRRFTAADPFLPRPLLSRLRRVSGATFEWICRGGSVSLSAWLGSFPFILWYFHLVTPVSLLANLVVVPIAFFILAIALLSILTAPLWSWLSIVFNNANWLLAQLVLVFVHWFAQLPGGHYYVAEPNWTRSAPAKMVVLDLGAGAAVHLSLQGANWLFDCGSERDYDRVLREYLHAAGVNRINGLLLSHGDSLHIGGTGPLLQDFAPQLLIDNPAADRSLIHRRLRRAFVDRKINPTHLSAGNSFEISPQLTGRVLFPPREYAAATTADDAALVVQLVIGRATKVLFVSDSGYATENALLDSGADLQSDVVIKGQHHSGKSGGERFLDAVKPRLIVATSRNFPEYERISDEWANAVRTKGIKLFRQDETGAVEFCFGQCDWSARAYVTGETFRSANR
jgi:competence protein ComEC